jgi:2-polyprenyl-3-methyl-5-hydroxy-6-metoxy-1,4-benzoquinol methylase
MSRLELTERDLAEVKRSASEAAKVTLLPFDPKQIARYMNPSANTVYPLEYAFHLLGDVRGKVVLDLGCGSGESTVPLAKRGARVIGMDISPDLIELAKKRVQIAGVEAELTVRSAYETGLQDQSVDVIFCMSLVHHLEIPRVREEMRRILAGNGYVILKEPVRFSKGYAALRNLLPSHADISDAEHPLTREELQNLLQGFVVEGLRYFRLPIVPLALRSGLPGATHTAWTLSDWLLRIGGTLAERYATSVAVKMNK